jgi:hypothetical protein
VIPVDEKVYKILSSVLIIDINTQKEREVQNLLSSYIVNTIKQDNKYDNVNVSTFVKDTSLQHWKPKAHFTKVFNKEIQHAKLLYDITRSEVSFLYSLSPYLLWENNLLVDEEDTPLNQKGLAKLLDVDPKTIQRNMKVLESKKCIYSIPFERDVFYLVNPYLMYAGQQINCILPSLFIELGYESGEKIKTNRYKVTKNNEIKA